MLLDEELGFIYHAVTLFGINRLGLRILKSYLYVILFFPLASYPHTNNLLHNIFLI